jgi:ankyrin repeat protein
MPSPLMQALYEGKTDEAMAIAEARTDLDVFEAAGMGDIDRLRTLLDADPSLANAWSDDGFTPLHFAAFFGHPEAAKLLADRGAGLEARSTNEQFALDATPLHSAAAAGERGVINVLLDAGADVNAVQHGGYTPLLEAAASGKAELADALLERGADPSAQLDDGRNAVDLATAGGHAELAGRLERARSTR